MIHGTDQQPANKPCCKNEKLDRQLQSIPDESHNYTSRSGQSRVLRDATAFDVGIALEASALSGDFSRFTHDETKSRRRAGAVACRACCDGS